MYNPGSFLETRSRRWWQRTSFIAPHWRQIFEENSKYQLRWIDQWDLTSLSSENVDLANSQAALRVPLVDIAVSPGLHISLSMSYTSGDSSSQSSGGPLGNSGWTLHNAQEYILMDHKQSAFPHNSEFQMVSEGETGILKPVKDREGHYFIKDEPDIEVQHDKDNQRWIVDTPNLRTVYGRPLETDIPEAIQWSLHWPHWRGPGTKEQTLENEAIVWFMVTREEKHGLRNKLYYTYHTEDRSLDTNPNKKFTSVVQLKSIADQFNNHNLTLHYEAKDPTEYPVKQYKNAEGKIQFPVHLLSKLSLVGYHLETPEFHQELQFQYNVTSDNVRELVKITQNPTSTWRKIEPEVIFDFKYDSQDGHHLLKEMNIPACETQIKYDYTKLEVPLVKFERESFNTRRYPAIGNVQISQGSQFGTMAFDLGTGGIYVRVFNRQITRYDQELYTCPTGRKFWPSTESWKEMGPRASTEYIKRFAVLLYPTVIAVLEEMEEGGKRLHIFHKNRDTKEFPNCPSHSYKFPENSLFRYTDEFMAIAKNDPVTPGHLMVIEPEKSEEDEDKIDNGYLEILLQLPNHENRNILRLVTQDGVILAYNGNRLYGLKENLHKIWTTTQIFEAISGEEAFFRKFPLEKEMKTSIIEQMQVYGLHMVDNMVLLGVLDWQYRSGNNSIVTTNAHLLLLNDDLRPAHRWTHQVKQERIRDCQEMREEEDGSRIYFRYRDNSTTGHFHAVVHDITGKMYEESCEGQNGEEAKRKCKQQLINFYNDNFGEDFKSMVLFDPEPFFTFSMDISGGRTVNRKLEISGSDWELKSISDDGVIKLGTGYILETKDDRNKSETEYFMYRQNPEDGGRRGQVLENFVLDQSSGMAMGYPSYLGVQPDLRQVPELIPFRKEEYPLENIRFGERGEQLLRLSNHEILVTIMNSTDPTLYPFDKEVIVRRVNSVVPSTPMMAVSRLEVLYGEGEKRVRSFVNEFNCNEGKVAQENRVKVVPLGDKNYAGYYEELTLVPIEAPENATKFQRWFDNRDELVIEKQVETTLQGALSQEDDEQDLRGLKILDITGQLEIADTRPFNVTQDSVAYFGFESYENNTVPFECHGSTCQVLEDGFPFTGSNYLQLKRGDIFTGSLTPGDQQTTFVASTWIRLPHDQNTPKLEVNAPTDIFKCQLTTHTGLQFVGLYAQFKRQIRDWLYLEAILDLHKIRTNVYSEFYRHSDQEDNLPPPSTTNFTVTLELSPGDHEWLHIDHIRFSPIQHDLVVNIYDRQSGIEIENILAGGTVLRKIFDRKGFEMGSIDEAGELEQFKSVSRPGFIYPPPTSDSNLGIQNLRREVVMTPEGGLYQLFDEYFQREIWSIEDAHLEDIWVIRKGRLCHLSDDKHSLVAVKPEEIFDPESSSLRLHIHLPSDKSSMSISVNGFKEIIHFTGNGTLNVVSGCRQFFNMPTSGELLIHLMDQSLWLWFDGVLLLDRKLGRGCLPPGIIPSTVPWSEFQMELSGPVTISDMITMKSPQVSMQYFNGWGERTQIIQLETSDSALVSETIYDELGRDAIKTKSVRITRTEDATPLLNYHLDFVQNRNPTDPNSVFNTGVIQGLCDRLSPSDEGYPYFRTIYHDDMLRETKVEGLPGKLFSTSGPFSKLHTRSSGLNFIEVLFPVKNGFRESVTYEPNGTIKVSVYDSRHNEVATYSKVIGFDNILTIYEYDDQGKLAKMVPPAYHEKMNTFMRTRPWVFGDEGLTEEEIYWQDKLCTHFRYDEMNQLVLKKSPDHKPKGFIYDSLQNLRFMYTLNANATNVLNATAENVAFMLHVGQSKPVEIGFMTSPVKVEELMKFQNGTDIPKCGDPQIHQRIIYSDNHANPDMRGKLRLFLTYDDHHNEDPTRAGAQAPPHQELLKFDDQNHVVMKTSNAVYSEEYTNYRKEYKGGKLREMMYPQSKIGRGIYSNRNGTETTFNLAHHYDKLGRLKELGTRGRSQTFAQFGYNSAGQVETEVVEETAKRYEYNSPGHLTKIEDPYLSQTMTFTDQGYGQEATGDGIIMKSIFNASWAPQDNEQLQWFRLPEEEFSEDKVMTMCIQALKRLGLIDGVTGVPLKFITKAVLSKLPAACVGATGHELMKLVAKYLPTTSHYGHTFSYGNHEESVKAKFSGGPERESMIGPLQVKSFLDEIAEVESLEVALDIWDKLVDARYLLVDNGKPDDKTAAIGKEGLKSIFRYSDLQVDLREVDEKSDVFAKHIMDLIIDTRGQVDVEMMKDKYVEWLGYLDMPTAIIIIERAKIQAEKIYSMLTEKGYLTDNIMTLLDPEYIRALSGHQDIIGKIINVLVDHFREQIGTNVFDYESYDIDANGNHRMFYRGLHKYTLEYTENTNQVSKVIVQDPYAIPGEDERVTAVEHDSHGNVCMAEHKGIKRIQYHPVTNRPILIEMADGRMITIRYDAQGERILKRVFTPDRKLISETKYLRDENGAVLMDKLTKFDEGGNKIKELESTYLYGPRGVILGFIRNGKFYNVFTDHSGSPRLITQGGRVVAGYDYWPYGELMKIFGDSDAHLVYRFTGQEFDEETGLYNFHARLYDPTIGRFFQPDPKSQYASPYVYGGNSPISRVDPDGEFFLELIMIITMIVGAYLAASAANGTWNPAKWNWKSGKTWLAIIGGGIAGATLPYTIAALPAAFVAPAILVGIGGSYINMVKSSGSWNPGDWDWTSPVTYNAFFEGFSQGVSLVSGAQGSLKGMSKFVKTFSTTGQQIMVIGAQVGLGMGMAVVKGAFANGRNFKFWEWDWQDPATYSAIVDGFFTGAGIPEKMGSAYKSFADMNKDTDWGAMLKDWKGTTKKFIKDVFKNPKHPLWKTLGKAVISFIMTGASEGSLDFTKWDWNSLSTYEGILNNYKFASEIKSVADVYRGKESKLNVTDVIFKQINIVVRLLPVVELITKDFTDFWDVNRPWIPTKRMVASEMDGVTMGKLALQIFSGLPGPQKLVEGNDQSGEFMEVMEELIGGLEGGGEIFPVGNINGTGIDDLVDCDGGEAFKKCSIASNDGRISRGNGEVIRKMFKASRLYQSKNEFVQVKASKEPQDYVEHLVEAFGMLEGVPENFFLSFFTGSIYNSLLNRKSDGQKMLYYKFDQIPGINLPIIHFAMETEHRGIPTLIVRTILPVEVETFHQIKTQLVAYLKELRFECHFEDPLFEVIKGESIVIAMGPNGSQELFIMTPDYTLDSTGCNAMANPFLEIPNPTLSLTESFGYTLSPQLSIIEKVQRFENFVEALKTNFDQSLNGVIGNPSFTGYAYGFLSFNLRETHDLAIELGHFGGETENILVVARKPDGSRQVMNTAPLIIRTHLDNPSYPTDGGLSLLLHKATLHTFEKTSIIANIEADLISMATKPVPLFTPIVDLLFTRDTTKVTNILQYIYHSHQALSKIVPVPVPDNSHFMSNFILGEMLSRMRDPSIEIFVLIPTTTSGQSRLKTQRLFFLRDLENNKCAILNTVESSIPVNDRFEFNPNAFSDIPMVPNVEIASLHMFTVKLNTKSTSGWDMDSATTAGVTPEQIFLNDIQVVNVDHRFIPRDTKSYLKLESPMESLPAHRGQLSFTQSYIFQMFLKLSENRLHFLLQNDEDFQSVVTGIMMGSSSQLGPDVDGINLVFRKFAGRRGATTPPEITPMSLISISKEGKLVPHSEDLLIAALKLSPEGDPDDVEEKFEDALESLEEYHCTSEAFLGTRRKVMFTPAVYMSGNEEPPVGESRVNFKVDPESLTNLNCTAVVNPFQEFLKSGKISGFNHPEGESNWEKASTNDEISRRCHLGAWRDGQYSMDGITCLSDKSTISVFRHIDSNDMVTEGSRWEPFNLVGDNFRKDKCKPVEFNGRPSVACEGEKATLIYTPFHEPRFFDELDGNLLLGRVALHWGGKIWKFFKGEGGAKWGMGETTHVVSDDMFQGWVRDAGVIREIIGKWKGLKDDVIWAENQLQECLVALEEIKVDEYKASPERIEEIAERLEALKEDLSEQILYAEVDNILKHVDFQDTSMGMKYGALGNSSYTSIGNYSGNGFSQEISFT